MAKEEVSRASVPHIEKFISNECRKSNELSTLGIRCHFLLLPLEVLLCWNRSHFVARPKFSAESFTTKFYVEPKFIAI